MRIQRGGGRSGNKLEGKMNRKLPPYLYERKYKTSGGYLRTLYYVRFVDWKGVERKFPAGPDFKIAKRYCDELRGLNAKRHDFDADKNKSVGVTFSAWKLRYLEMCKNKRSLSRDVEHIEHLEAFFGKMFLKQIFGTIIIEYKNLRLVSPIMRYKKPVKDKFVKISTVNRELSCLHRMLKLAARDGVIETVPVIEFDSEQHLARERTLSEAEFSKLLEQSPPWLCRVFELALGTAWDRGDLLPLTWTKNVLWDDPKRRGIRLFGRKKTGVKAFIPIMPGDRLEAVLDKIWQDRGKVRPINDLVLTNEGRPITKDQLRSAFGKARDAAGIEDFRFKDFRHTAKTRWAAMGIPAEAAMAMAGHASVEMHYRYVNLTEEDIRSAVKTATYRRNKDLSQS